MHRAALEIAAQTNPKQAWPHILWNTSIFDHLQFYVSLLPKLDIPESHKKLIQLVEDQRSGRQSSHLALDVYQAATNRKDHQDAWRADLEKASPLGKYQLALHGGNAERGHAIYRNHVSAQCVRCHEAGGAGKQAGPVLDGIASRVDRQYLLESLVAPSAHIAKGYASVTLLLVDGRSVTGSIIQESEDQLVLGLPNGKRTEISTAEVEERVETKLSAMPEMTNVLTMFEIRDLVAYLATRTEQPPKSTN